MDDSLYDKLSVLNQIYQNTFTSTSTFQNPTTIKTPLYPHQSSFVQGMHAYRDKMLRGFMMNKQAINGKIGIIADPPGSGKTLSILTYLASYKEVNPNITCELTNHSSKYFFSHELHEVTGSSANLIIVPHSLFHQWRHEIDHHTTMTYVPIETKRMIKGENLTKTMISSAFVLTTNKCYKYVHEYATANHIQWNNVFIDEASSIYIHASDPSLRFQFLWLVTNNWIPLVFKNPSINKDHLLALRDRVSLHPDLEKWLVDHQSRSYEGAITSSGFLKNYLPLFHPHRGMIVLLNSYNLLSSSMNLPDISTEIIQCRPNITLNSLASFYLARNREPSISSKSVPHLFQALGIEWLPLEEYISFQPAIKHAMIQRKAQENECVICLETCTYPTIVNCCYQTYCGACLLTNTILNYKCPTCREVLNISDICCLSSLSKKDIIICKNKSEICLDLFKQNINKSFIIYSAFDNIYYQLSEEINKLGLKAERIESNLFSLLKTIKKFKEGVINILFVSNIDYIRGLSLLPTSHLIFYHELPVYEAKQVLIHSCQRLGRKQPLQILHLQSEIQV